MNDDRITSCDIRARFSAAMSSLYQREVPLYSTLLDLVAAINHNTPETEQRMLVERHGAIRLGTQDELATCRRIFGIMGMFPVGYYDLSIAGVPVHSTAFRPLDPAALARNPFRVFTSLLRLELIEDANLRAEAAEILSQRKIFTPSLLTLLDEAETSGGLTFAQADLFIAEVLKTFRWHARATVDAATYQRMHAAHPLLADIICFPGPHINHLTPRTHDIDAVQDMMTQHHMKAKSVIEGPPRRAVPILLRQTSFTALSESVTFPDGTLGTHTARFGEIEQRGAALTPKGRALYDTLLAQARSDTQGSYSQRLEKAFSAFPDDAETLRREELAFFTYALAPDAPPASTTDDLEILIATGAITATAVTYEDFLPVSAAGIFQSNLGEKDQNLRTSYTDRTAFEAALGTTVTDEMDHYAAQQAASLRHVNERLCLSECLP